METLFGSSAVLEAARHASSIIRELYASSSPRNSRAESPDPDGAPLLPWEDQPKTCQEAIKDRVLSIAERPEAFARESPEAVGHDLSERTASSGAVLQVDPKLRNLRFMLVPKHTSEESFWRTYWDLVGIIKADVVSMMEETVYVSSVPEAGSADACSPSVVDSQTSCHTDAALMSPRSVTDDDACSAARHWSRDVVGDGLMEYEDWLLL